MEATITTEGSVNVRPRRSSGYNQRGRSQARISACTSSILCQPQRSREPQSSAPTVRRLPGKCLWLPCFSVPRAVWFAPHDSRSISWNTVWYRLSTYPRLLGSLICFQKMWSFCNSPSRTALQETYPWRGACQRPAYKYFYLNAIRMPYWQLCSKNLNFTAM